MTIFNFSVFKFWLTYYPILFWLNLLSILQINCGLISQHMVGVKVNQTCAHIIYLVHGKQAAQKYQAKVDSHEVGGSSAPVPESWFHQMPWPVWFHLQIETVRYIFFTFTAAMKTEKMHCSTVHAVVAM